MSDIDTKRLFIAIELSLNIRSRLETLQKELKKSGADAKWVEPENIHLTLKFLGNVETKKNKDIMETLNKICAQRKRFTATLDQLGAFPSLNSARVVWAGLNDKTDTLENIAEILDEALSQLKFEKETRKFQTHVTLARIRSARNRVALIQKIKEANQNFKTEDFSIDNITLFESRLSPHGPTYAIVHQAKLL